MLPLSGLVAVEITKRGRIQQELYLIANTQEYTEMRKSQPRQHKRDQTKN